MYRLELAGGGESPIVNNKQESGARRCGVSASCIAYFVGMQPAWDAVAGGRPAQPAGSGSKEATFQGGGTVSWTSDDAG